MIAEQAGITHIELSSGVSPAPDLLSSVRSYKDRLEFLVHNYFPPPASSFVLNLAALDDDTLQRSRQHCRSAIDLAAELSCPFYSVHSGFALRIRPEMLGQPDAQSIAPLDPYEKAYAVFVQSVQELCKHCDERGIDFVIENNVLAPKLAQTGRANSLLMSRAEEVVRLMNDVSHPRLGLLVDTGHVKVSATALGFTPESFIRDTADFIRAFHLSDNNGLADQNRTFDRDAWFAPALKDFPSSTIVVEAYKLTAQQMRSSLDLAESLQSGVAL